MLWCVKEKGYQLGRPRGLRLHSFFFGSKVKGKTWPLMPMGSRFRRFILMDLLECLTGDIVSSLVTSFGIAHSWENWWLTLVLRGSRRDLAKEN